MAALPRRARRQTEAHGTGTIGDIALRVPMVLQMSSAGNSQISFELRPGGLWSLWEMVNFSFAFAHDLLEKLSVLIEVSCQNMKAVDYNAGSRKVAIDQSETMVKCCVELTETLFAKLKSDHIDSAMERLRRFLHNPFEWSELNTRSRALRDAVEVELRQYLYYQYPKNKGERLRVWQDEWKTTLSAFPSARDDIYSAVDCYALQHNTASIFHSMRIAELGLRALAKERKIRLPKKRPLEWGTWLEIIKKLDAEILAIGSKKPGAPKDNALEFYSGARADLNGFKDEYRNSVMHVRATYDEHQALRALVTTHAFMERMAAKLDHRHYRIRWGFR
jgi:hypothetical protein